MDQTVPQPVSPSPTPVQSPETPAVSVSSDAWDVHPARRQPGRAVAGAVVIAAMATLAALLMGSSIWAVIAAGILVAALNRFYFPSRFEIDDEGITAIHPLRRQRFRWADVRWFRCDRRGGYLSTRPRPSWLDGARGMALMFGGHGEAADRIRRHLPEGAER